MTQQDQIISEESPPATYRSRWEGILLTVQLSGCLPEAQSEKAEVWEADTARKRPVAFLRSLWFLLKGAGQLPASNFISLLNIASPPHTLCNMGNRGRNSVSQTQGQWNRLNSIPSDQGTSTCCRGGQIYEASCYSLYSNASHNFSEVRKLLLLPMIFNGCLPLIFRSSWTSNNTEWAIL